MLSKFVSRFCELFGNAIMMLSLRIPNNVNFKFNDTLNKFFNAENAWICVCLTSPSLHSIAVCEIHFFMIRLSWNIHHHHFRTPKKEFAKNYVKKTSNIHGLSSWRLGISFLSWIESHFFHIDGKTNKKQKKIKCSRLERFINRDMKPSGARRKWNFLLILVGIFFSYKFIFAGTTRVWISHQHAIMSL